MYKYTLLFIAVLSLKINLAQNSAIHCLGNGKMLVYEEKEKITQIFGPPYSSPNYISLSAIMQEGIEIKSERISGTAIWKHTIFKNNQIIGEITDFVSSSSPCLIRKINMKEDINFLLDIKKEVELISNGKTFKDYNVTDALLTTAKPGTYIYGKYPFPTRIYQQIILKGNAKILNFSKTNDENRWVISFAKGESFLYISDGPSYPECISNSYKILKADYQTLYTETQDYWNVFSKRRIDFDAQFSKQAPARDSLLRIIDEVSVMLKVQQAEEGSVIAGYNYHLGYVRDQYGVFRCYLKLGYTEEAKAIINFYWNIFKKYGILHNAQAIGVDGIFHIHENDESEITGYLLIQAFDYLDKTKDIVFIKEILPMLEWAFEAQKRMFHNNMLPFNGDETYIAGGVLPRSEINDGSAEATLLFIMSGEKLLKFVQDNKLWAKDKIAENRRFIKEIRDNYRNLFYEDKMIVTNNPDRLKDLQLPDFRHGVCEGITQPCLFFGWTQKNKNGRYLCPICFNSKDLAPAEHKKYYLLSVSLTPLYFGSDMFSNDEINFLTEQIIAPYRKTGKLSSNAGGNITVGYDYGLLLYSLVKLKNPFAYNIYKKMLSMTDETGSWVEYYEDDKPAGTLCRPWESAINLEAGINYLLSTSKK